MRGNLEITLKSVPIAYMILLLKTLCVPKIFHIYPSKKTKRNF